jgi:diadenylate cyclase
MLLLLAQFDFRQMINSLVERAIDRPGPLLVELLLIGIVVYLILNFLRGTRGARIVLAVVMILGVSFAIVRLLAETYDLDRVKVLYPYFVLGVFLIWLVAFQPDLRRMLLHVGAVGWLSRWSKDLSGEVVDPVVSAVERLSKNKIGALIAIERVTQMGAVIESGTPIDSKVTSELLETIFWPGTALHDMGVIIRQGRIAAAGCQFPLAESGEIDRALGSRHRAAVGLSQEVDAIVIVVSEETGTISVALHGRLRRSLTPDGLRETLIREMSGAAAPRTEAEAA